MRFVVLEEVKCPKCGYTWYTRVQRQYVVCPNCHYTFKKERGLVNLVKK